MRCPQCQTENPTENRFCDQCGGRLEARCPQCGAALRAEARFCGACGAPVAAPGPEPARQPGTYTPKHLADKILKSRSALEGERRQVTVLFADVAGFTTLAEQRDPEEVHTIIDRCFDAVTAEVHRFEGTINQYTGDGVMALFGAPIAHEDSPRRAVHAALGIQRALRDLSRDLEAAGGPSLKMRIGINTGPVVVGRIGDDLRMDYTAVGDTTNLAARLQQAARPGSVVVSEAAHKAIGGFFETLDLAEVAIKGHAPVHAFEVLRSRGRRSRLEVTAEAGLTPLVGRSRELDIIRERFAEAKLGRGQVVSITGEAGIGKSRLILEFRRRLAEAGEDITWLEGQCVSFGQSIPFLPVIEQLRRNFGIEEFDGEPEIVAKVEHGMRRMGQLETYIPYIRYLLSVDPGEPKVAAIDAAARRARIFEAVRALSLRGAQLRPIILVFEDLHWVDSSTEEYLGSLMDSLASPIMLILTYRIGYASPFGARSFHTTLTLQSLSGEETLAMAGRVLGAEQFPRELREALMAKAEGVPLFVEEVTKTLLELGVLRRENGGYRLVRRIDEVTVPDTIQGIIMARLDRLGEDGKRTVQLASVIGRQFLVRLLQRITDIKTELDGLLRELKSLEIIYELGLLPEPAYIFKHAVIQDVAYQSLLVQRRRELHRAVGQAIEELYADRLADHYEELAHHFAQGEEWAKAFDYLVRSGDKAKDAYANQTALDFYGRALDVAARVTPKAASSRIMEIHQRRGRIYILLSRFAEAIGEAEEMLQTAQATDDRRAEGEALADLAYAHYATFSGDHVPHTRSHAERALAIGQETGDEHLLAKSLTYLGAVDQIDGKLEEANQKIEESIRISEARGFKGLLPANFLWLGAHSNWQGKFRKAIEVSRRGEQVAAEVHDALNESLCMAFCALAHIGLGEYGQGLALINEGLAKARERNNTFFLGRFTNSLGWLYQELGDFKSAEECDREGTDLGQRYKIPNVEISSLINLGFDYLKLGDPAKALALLEETLVRAEKGFGAHRWRWDMRLTAALAEALMALGRAEEAARWIERAETTARATGSAKYLAKCHALRGEIALRARRWNDAAGDLGQALALARRIEHPTLIWQAAHLLARAQEETGKEPDAVASARVCVETIETVAARAPDAALRRTFLEWSRVQAAREDLERILR